MTKNLIPVGEVNIDFYNAMFGSVHACNSMSAIESGTYGRVVNMLKDPKELSDRMPLLPEMLIKLLDALKDPHSDIFTYLAIIEKDPTFAAKVVEVANTARYNRNNTEVVYLRKAASFLGTSGLMKIASTLLLSEVIPCEPIFYKLYGRQIWTHSVQCASLCELLAKEEGDNEADAYFIGLIHDLGRIIVFHCLTEVTGKTFRSLMPSSREFKVLMTDLSLEISHLLAQEWQLPSIYIVALEQQKEQTHDTLAELLFRANRLSEHYLLWQKHDVVMKDYQKLQQQLAISDQVFEQFNELAPEIAANMS
ncbi:metal-dependent phosphohydrolase [Thalassotalea insulae]|uniref:Metal-dependent phosphohydrolase n=1 Tax=Thalassotalea insulae TaxID=2056778 RepID=A0ABQ6GRP2_9GAMM|nr:HDOD domain-containing protein [Thalassotalea insulae]GLX78623.1 metal-dependent phosphohydrolase [Thalassotalea insulae]